MTLPLSDFRQQFCLKDEVGQWLCRQCRAPLAEDEGTQCAACNERTEHERRERDRAEDRKRWENERRCDVARVLEQLPKWPHLLSATDTAAVIDRRLLSVAERWAPAMGSLLLLGPSGAGKTTAAARTLHRLGVARLSARLEAPNDLAAKRDFIELVGVLWAKASAIGRALSEHRLGAGREPELMTQSLQASVLFVDELGPEAPHHVGPIFDLVDRRSDAQRPIVVTSGLSVEAFQGRYGTGMFRRLTERGLGALVDVHPVERRRGG